VQARRKLVAIALPLIAAVAACSGATSSDAMGTATLPATPSFVPVTLPVPTDDQTATASPDEGNVDGAIVPALSIEPVAAQTIRVTLADGSARAWRVTVQGTGNRAGDRWVFEVDTGDVGYTITAQDAEGGVEGVPREQPGLAAGQTDGSLCSSALPVCVAADSVRLPENGDGTLVLELTRTDAMQPLEVAAATAGWQGDPFTLGPWTITEAFPWDS
jgi:hypothetical protein